MNKYITTQKKSNFEQDIYAYDHNMRFPDKQAAHIPITAQLPYNRYQGHVDQKYIGHSETNQPAIPQPHTVCAQRRHSAHDSQSQCPIPTPTRSHKTHTSPHPTNTQWKHARTDPNSHLAPYKHVGSQCLDLARSRRPLPEKRLYRIIWRVYIQFTLSYFISTASRSPSRHTRRGWVGWIAESLFCCFFSGLAHTQSLLLSFWTGQIVSPGSSPETDSRSVFCCFFFGYLKCDFVLYVWHYFT